MWNWLTKAGRAQVARSVLRTSNCSPHAMPASLHEASIICCAFNGGVGSKAATAALGPPRSMVDEVSPCRLIDMEAVYTQAFQAKLKSGKFPLSVTWAKLLCVFCGG